jgi:hypothetical protein
MRNHEIESWALSVIDRVTKGQAVEDSRVELKLEWPEAKRAARRLAGHANAARGEAILWVIGIDEKTGKVSGVEFSELASWYNAVRAVFDELAPEPISLNIPAEGKTVAGLYFETDRAPYVVKVQEGKGVQREVPWRIATGVESVTRSQLLRLLAPLEKRLEVELLAGHIRIDRAVPVQHKTEGGDEFVDRYWKFNLFVGQPMERLTIIHRFRSRLRIRFGNHDFGTFRDLGFNSADPSVHITSSVVSIRGPALIHIENSVTVQMPSLGSIKGTEAEVAIELGAANLEAPILVKATLPSKLDGPKLQTWGIGEL